MKNLGLTLLFLTVIFGCKKKEVEIGNADFAGFYKITAIESSMALDMNNDGIKSTDILSEMEGIHTSPTGQKGKLFLNNFGFYARVRPNELESSKDRFIDLKFPMQNFSTEFGTTPILTSYQGRLGGEYQFIDNKTVRVTENEADIRNGYGKINTVKLTGVDTFTAEISTQVFDFVDMKKYPVTLNVQYKKDKDTIKKFE